MFAFSGKGHAGFAEKEAIKADLFKTHLETAFVWKAVIRVDRKNGEKTGSRSLPGRPITALEKPDSEVTHHQWLKRRPKIFLPVRRVIFSAPQDCLKEKFLLNFNSIMILAVGSLYCTGSMSVGPGIIWLKWMFHSLEENLRMPGCLFPPHSSEDVNAKSLPGTQLPTDYLASCLRTN